MLSFVFSELRTFLQFARKPFRTFKQRSTTKEAIAAVGALFLVLALIEVFLFIPLLYLKQHMTDVVSVYKGESLASNFMTGVLVAPILEELINRAGLRKGPYLLLFGMPLVTTVVGYAPVGAGMFVALVFIAAAGELRQKPGLTFQRGRAVIAHFPLLFWMFALAFGIFHFDAYNANGTLSPIVPVLLLSPVLGGLMLGYVRIRYGLLAAIALHIANNLMALTFMHGFGVPY